MATRARKTPVQRKPTLGQRMDRLEEAVASLIEQVENLVQPTLPEVDDEIPDGTVIRWTVQFRPGQRIYTYAALRAGHVWWPTGAPAIDGPYTWKNLVVLLSKDTVREIDYSSEWKRLGQ